MHGIKSKYSRRYARKGRKAKVSGLLKSKPTAITTLAKAVKSLQMKDKRKRVFLNYSQQYNSSIGGTGVDIFPLSKCSTWTPVFGTGANDGQANSMIHKSMGIDMYLTLENTLNEPDTTQFTIFIVSLKDDSIQNTFDQNTGNLAIANGTHFVVQGGMVLLNKKVFEIHAIKRKVLTNHGTALSGPSAQTQSGTDYRHYFKVRVGKKIINPYGDWNTLACPGDPSKNYYLLCFSDNSSADLQNPRLQMNIVHSVEQLA